METRDREAIEAAIEVARADPELRDQLEHLLSVRPRWVVGLHAAALCQIKSLRLKPWEAAPVDTCDGPPANCYGHRPAEIELRARMKRAGISVFHPDPLAALAAVERAA
jgi:hypothetical protein